MVNVSGAVEISLAMECLSVKTIMMAFLHSVTTVMKIVKPKGWQFAHEKDTII